ncbi:hypothetical protein JTB14_014046 [Gonioctena quinquepunctata]|nr:hypothetical protein JTB14_014046 [Gonioctena quinquepunctata]
MQKVFMEDLEGTSMSDGYYTTSVKSPVEIIIQTHFPESARIAHISEPEEGGISLLSYCLEKLTDIWNDMRKLRSLHDNKDSNHTGRQKLLSLELSKASRCHWA